MSLAVFAFAMFFTSSLVAKADTFPLFVSQMHVGDNNSQVRELQSFLATNPAIYSQGIVTGYFGGMTQVAVGQFQLNYNLATPGVVGPATLLKLNEVITAGYGIDISAPVINNVNIQAGNSNAIVNWTTDTSAQGKVFYSTSPLQEIDAQLNFAAPYISGPSVQSDVNYKTSQSVSVNGLSSNTTYYYVIMSTDQAGNVSVTVEGNFKTM